MTAHPFHVLHTHGLIRVAAAAPVASVGDTVANAEATIALAREADARGVDLVVFPELNLTSYAIDDLHLQTAQHHATEAAIGAVAAATADLGPVLLVGAAIPRNGRLYNCAVAIARGRILGVVPKTFLPNYREYYEKRWFASGLGLDGAHITVAGQRVPFGPDLLFAANDLEHFVFHAEICEDYWAPIPPSTAGALAGALICCNLSASNVVIGKARERAMLSAAQSARAVCGYVYSAAGPGESTTEVAWDGQGMIHELGELLAESVRFATTSDLVVADLDVERIEQERMRTGTFNDAARAAGDPEKRFRRIGFEHGGGKADIGLERDIRRFPFVPNNPDKRDADCYEAFNIQVTALAKRLDASGIEQAGDRRLRRARLDPRADRRGQGDGPVGSPARRHPGFHDAGLRDRRGEQGQRLGADEGAGRHRRGSGHPARGPAHAGGYRSPLRGRRAGV